MIDKKETKTWKEIKIKTWVVLVIIASPFILVYIMSSLEANKDSKVGNIQTTSTPNYTSENCIHDLAIRNANAVKKDMNSGVPFSETREINRLSEYERQKTECYKNFQ